jgi:hypothetical protein
MRAPLGLIAIVAACGGGDPLADEKDIAGWANSSSAMGAYEWVREPVAFADGEFTYEDAQCPTASDTGTTATVTGNCTDAKGRAWTGTASVDHGSSTRTVTLTDFGNDAFGGSVKATGTVTITEEAPDRHSFAIDLVGGGGITTTTKYNGTVVGTYDTPTTWNGSGSITRDGDFFNGGTVTATTVDQVRDNTRCPGEGFSGTTTITSDEHVAVITYDGSTACDPDHSARWTLDGEDQGTLAGVTCSAGGSGTGWVALALAALLLTSRRSSRGSCPSRTRR